jgi:hypothetical protein
MMTFFNSILYNHILILFLSIFTKNIYSNSISSEYKIMLNIYFFSYLSRLAMYYPFIIFQNHIYEIYVKNHSLYAAIFRFLIFSILTLYFNISTMSYYSYY